MGKVWNTKTKSWEGVVEDDLPQEWDEKRNLRQTVDRVEEPAKKKTKKKK